jgi:hypothetical protein
MQHFLGRKARFSTGLTLKAEDGFRRWISALSRSALKAVVFRYGPVVSSVAAALGVSLGLVAYDFAGKQRWQTPLGPFNSGQHPTAASSPTLRFRGGVSCYMHGRAFLQTSEYATLLRKESPVQHWANIKG